MGELEYTLLDIPIENKKSKVTLMSYFKLIGISLEEMESIRWNVYQWKRKKDILSYVYYL